MASAKRGAPQARVELVDSSDEEDDAALLSRRPADKREAQAQRLLRKQGACCGI